MADPTRLHCMKENPVSLREQLADFRAAWHERVPADRQEMMLRHIQELRDGAISKTMLKVGDRAPPIVLADAKGETVDVGDLLKQGPVIVTFYRGGWCPFCNMELKAYQLVLPEIAAAGASLVAISPEKPGETVSTAEKNALTFHVLSDVGQKVGRAFGLVYEFTDELRTVYDGFGLDIPARNGSPDEWALPISATYVIGRDGTIIYANTDVDYRDRADPRDVLGALTRQTAAA
jgi:peroxiredoxin